MKRFLILLFCVSPLFGQSAGVSVNLAGGKTVDSVAVLLTAGACELSEKYPTSAIAAALLAKSMTVTFSFPANGVLGISGNTVTFRTTQGLAVIGVSAIPSTATLSTTIVTATGP